MLNFKLRTMKWSITALAGAMAFGVVVPAAAQSAIGPHAPICDRNGNAVLVNVTGLRARTGTIRVQLYANNRTTFLEKGRYLQRVDVPVTRSGDMAICVPVPRSGSYAVSVRHDQNGNGSSDRSDGVGFSGNPSVSLTDMIFKRKPSLATVAFPVDGDTSTVRVVLNYVVGMSLRPVR